MAYIDSIKPLTKKELESLLPCLDNARVGLIGDLCLDIYWDADMKKSELSRETPHHPLPVVSERFNPGGASNVAANIAALEPAVLSVVGVIGNDWRGTILLNELSARGIDTKLIVKDSERVTNTYIKPMRHGISDVVYEDPRLDFENYTALSVECEEKLLTALDKMAEQVDVICVADQFRCGCITPRIRERLGQLGAMGKTVIVDSRDHAPEYENVTLKPNEVEASRLFGNGGEATLDELSVLAQKIAERNGKLTLTTLGKYGCFVADKKSVVRVPAMEVEPPIDFCGAGDTFMSGFAAFFAGGASATDAARAANLCSSVTIKKIATTGTATRGELFEAAK